MLSLTNAYDFEELSKFDQRAKGVLRGTRYLKLAQQ